MVKFLAVEKLSVREIENKIPAIPSMIRKIWIGNFVEFSNFRSEVAVSSRMNKMTNPRKKSVETSALLEIRVRSR